MGRLHIAILSDLHIAPENEFPYRVDTRANFLSALDLLKKDETDLLILGGDLCFRDGDKEVYIWIKKQIEKLGIPYKVISGNHDNPSLIRAVFHPEKPMQGEEFYYTENIGGRELIFCDSTESKLSVMQWSWLKNTIEKREDNALIFIHHPPFECGVPYMDNHYAFQQIDKMEELISSMDQNLFFFCGHYHCEKTIIHQNSTVFINPSTFFNLDDRHEEFVILNNYPSFRRLIIQEEKIETSVFYDMSSSNQ